MVHIDANFTQAVLKDENKYLGKHVDANMTASPPLSYSRLPVIPNESHNFITALPSGDIICVCTIGTRHWSILSRIDAPTAHGVSESFFLKEYRDDNAKDVVRSEHESTVTLYAIVPANVPRPIAYGYFAEDAAR